MSVKDPQQVIQASNGSVIKNVVQIIQGDRPDVKFSSDSAQRIPNRIHREAVPVVRDEIRQYFWKPPDIEEALMDLEVQGWNIPLWRLHGEVLVSWKEWREEVVKETENYKQTQWVPREEDTTHDLDWLVPAHRATNSALRALSGAIGTLNRSQKAIRVDWQSYPFGESLEQMWPNLKAAYGGLPWRRKSAIANAQALFEAPGSAFDQGREKIKTHGQLSKLEPEISLLTAISRAERQIEEHLRNWAKKSGKRLTDFRIKLDVERAEQYWFPIWVAQYVYRGTQHAVVINGYNARPINAPLPLSFRAGFIAWSIVTLALIIPCWPFAAYFFYQFFSEPYSEFRFFGFFNAMPALFFALGPFVMTGLFVVIWWIQHHWLSK